MEYKMRALKTRDVFAVSKILKKMNLKPDLKEGTTQTELGITLTLLFCENLHLAQEEASSFLADLVGITKEAFEDLPIMETMEIIKLFKDQDGIADFLAMAGK